MSRIYRPLSHRISKIELIIAILAVGFVVNQLGHAIEHKELEAAAPVAPTNAGPALVMQPK